MNTANHEGCRGIFPLYSPIMSHGLLTLARSKQERTLLTLARSEQERTLFTPARSEQGRADMGYYKVRAMRLFRSIVLKSFYELSLDYLILRLFSNTASLLLSTHYPVTNP